MGAPVAGNPGSRQGRGFLPVPPRHGAPENASLSQGGLIAGAAGDRDAFSTALRRRRQGKPIHQEAVVKINKKKIIISAPFPDWIVSPRQGATAAGRGGGEKKKETGKKRKKKSEKKKKEKKRKKQLSRAPTPAHPSSWLQIEARIARDGDRRARDVEGAQGGPRPRLFSAPDRLGGRRPWLETRCCGPGGGGCVGWWVGVIGW